MVERLVFHFVGDGETGVASCDESVVDQFDLGVGCCVVFGLVFDHVFDFH